MFSQEDASLIANPGVEMGTEDEELEVDIEEDMGENIPPTVSGEKKKKKKKKKKLL
jgi:hypothetical protein